MSGFGFLPGRANQSGGSFSPDGTLPQYTSMTALAAGIASVGLLAELVGATTGEVILRARRVAEGAAGLITEGDWDLWQADGEEFDGAFAPLPLGAATAPTWGVAGDRATGGVSPAEGSLQFPGFRLQTGRRRVMSSIWYVDGLPDPVASNDCFAAGWARSAVGVVYVAGVGYSAAQYRAGGSIGGAADTVTWTTTPTASTPSVFGEFRTAIDMSQTGAVAASSAYLATAHHTTFASNPGWTSLTSASAGTLAADQVDFVATIALKGWPARCIVLTPTYS